MRLQAGTQASITAKRQIFITIPALTIRESGQKTHENTQRGTTSKGNNRLTSIPPAPSIRSPPQL
jgi:hypothetical protein